MSTKIRDFCINYKKKIVNDKDIQERELDFFLDYRERISFTVNMHSNNHHTMVQSPMRCGGSTTLFELDKEDLKYLYKKYSKKAKEELEKNIEDLRNNYKDT